MRRILLFCFASLLAGCAPMSAQQIREAGAVESFSVPMGYQAAYRVLVDEMRRCMQSGILGGGVTIQADLYTDIKRGTIVPTMYSSMGSKPLFVVDVAEVSADQARIDVASRSEGSNAKLLRGIFSNEPLCSK